MRRKLAFLLAVAMFVCLAQPGFAGKKDREYLDGVLAKEITKTHVVITHYIDNSHLDTTRYYSDHYFAVRVGRVYYVGMMEKKFFSTNHVNPRDWPEDKPVKVRFERIRSLGVSVTLMILQKPDGGEIEVHVRSIIDEDGNQLCGFFKC